MYPLSNGIDNKKVTGFPAGYAYQQLIVEGTKAVDYEILDMNETMKEIMNKVRLDEVTAARAGNSKENEEEAGWLDIYEQILHYKQTTHFEKYSPGADSWYRVQVIPHDETHFTVIFTDVTDSRRKQNGLQALFSGSLHIQLLLDKEGVISDANPAWESLTNLQKHKTKGTSLLSHVHKEDRCMTARALQRADAGETVKNLVSRIQTGNGEWRFMEWGMHEHERVIYGTALDVTDRYNKELELQRREAFLQYHTSQLPGGLYQLELDAEGHMSFPYYSENFREIFDVTAEEFHDNHNVIFKRVHPDDKQQVLDLIRHSRAHNQLWYHDFRIVTRNKEIRWMRGRAKPLILPDGGCIWYGYISDVSTEKRNELKARTREDQMNMLISQVPGLIYQFHLTESGEHKLKFTSEGMYHLIKVTPEEAYEDINKMFDRIHPGDFDLFKETIEESRINGNIWHLDFRCIHPDKGLRWLRANAKPAYLDNGITCFYGYTYDITEFKEKEIALEKRDRLISDISAQVPGVIYKFVSSGAGDYRFMMATGSLGNVFGKELEHKQVTDLKLERYVHEDDMKPLIERIDYSREEETEFDETFRIVQSSGITKWLHAASFPKKMENGETMWNGYLTDVTADMETEKALKESEEKYRILAEKMEKMAYYDPLTGLPNRRLLFERLQQQFLQANRTGSKVGVLFIDLDNFKAINDRFGHNAGDALLKGVAENLKQAIRESDIVARIAGDEFMVAFTNVYNQSQLEKAAESIQQVFRQQVEVDEHKVKVEASIGVSMYPDHGKDIEDLLRKADQAMYQRKRGNKNGLAVYREGMTFADEKESR